MLRIFGDKVLKVVRYPNEAKSVVPMYFYSQAAEFVSHVSLQVNVSLTERVSFTLETKSHTKHD